MMTKLIEKIKTTLSKLRNWISKEDRDNLEFDLNDLNINISWLEYDYDINYIKHNQEVNRKFMENRDKTKSDAACNKLIENVMADEIATLEKTEALIKMYKRLHQGFIRMAEHIKSSVIQEQADMKRNWGF